MSPEPVNATIYRDCSRASSFDLKPCRERNDSILLGPTVLASLVQRTDGSSEMRTVVVASRHPTVDKNEEVAVGKEVHIYLRAASICDFLRFVATEFTL